MFWSKSKSRPALPNRANPPEECGGMSCATSRPRTGPGRAGFKFRHATFAFALPSWLRTGQRNRARRSPIVPIRLPVPWRVWGYVKRDLKALAGPGTTCYLSPLSRPVFDNLTICPKLDGNFVQNSKETAKRWRSRRCATQSQSLIKVRDVTFSLHRSIDPDAGLLYHSLRGWLYSSRLG